MSAGRSTLVFDGDCGICRYWVNYWQGLTGDRIIYRPYQEAASDFPDIPRDAFARAVDLAISSGSTWP